MSQNPAEEPTQEPTEYAPEEDLDAIQEDFSGDDGEDQAW